MEKKVILKNLLLQSEQYPWNEYVYMTKIKDWSLDSECYIFNLNELSDDEDDPEFAIDNNLKCVLSVSDIQCVVQNIKQQKVAPSEQELFEAFMYYYKNDAFLDCENI